MTTLLLVEDHDMNRDMLKRRLARRGYEVLEADSAEEALRLIEYQVPDVVVLDMNLPGMDGWEAAGVLKAHPHTAHVPILGLSAHAMGEDRRKGLAAGCDDYDTKPVEFTRLLAKLHALVPPPQPDPV